VANGKANAADNPAGAVPFKLWFWGHIFDLLRLHGRTMLVCATVIWCVYEISQVMRVFAGQVTIASLTLRILVSVVFRWTVTIAVSGLSIALYLRERNQHQATRKRLSERNARLEALIDPNRTSSQLTAEGRTRREDE
jgi:hypothetical protein